MKTTVCVVLLLITGVWGSTYPSEDTFEPKEVKAMERLPTHITPHKYEITLEPNIQGRSLKGNVIIEVTVNEKSKSITMHSNQIEVDQKNVEVTSDGKAVDIADVKFNPAPQFLTINFKNDLEVGKRYIINFKSFTGILSETDKSGFYLAKYKDKKGNLHEFATTQFQSIGARRAFPCFDEPHFKANFTIHLIRPKTYMSLSNEELISSKIYTEKETEKYIDSYRETRKMSTYLIAFVVSEYIATETRQGQRVFADTDSVKNHEADYALQLGIEVLDKLEEFTGIRYTFSKLDQIAIPDADFSPGAMENWGLVTYRKSILVYPLNEQTTSGRERTISIIAHEYAHQWFGNLVTCSWWSYTWLNEGFADYFEYFIPKMLNWDMEGLFVLESVQGALAKDSVKSIVSMNSEGAPSIINYQKSGSVIRMLSHVVTQNIFEVALKYYLEKHAYTAVTPTDLYGAFQKILKDNKLGNLTDNVDVAQIMETWDSQAGYPLLTVTRDYENGDITISQKRFFTGEPITNDKSMWSIPINYVKEMDLNNDSFTNTMATDWLTKNSKTLNEKVKEGWIIFNKQQTGYYRVMYDEGNWKRLTEQLNEKDHTQIHIYNRAQLLDDIFTFASVDQVNYTTAFELTKFLRNEKEYVPIAAFLNHLGVIGSKLSNENARKSFKNYANHILSGAAFEEVDMTEKENEPITTQYLRATLMNWLCKFGNEQCKNFVVEAFKAKETAIPPNLQSAVYCGAIRAGTETEWNELLEMFKSTEYELRRSRMLTGLACTEEKELVNKFLNMALEDNRIDDVTAFRSVVSAGDFGVNSTFDFITNHFSKIKLLPSLNSILNTVAAQLHREEHVEAFKKLANENKDQAEVINNAKATIQANVDWNTKYGDTLEKWFKSYADNYVNKENSAIKFDVSLSLLLGTIFMYTVNNIVY